MHTCWQYLLLGQLVIFRVSGAPNLRLQGSPPMDSHRYVFPIIRPVENPRRS